MSGLSSKRCVPCEGGADPLASARAEELLGELDEDWVISQNGKEYWVDCFELLSGRVNKECEEGLEIARLVEQWEEDRKQLRPGELCLVDPVGDYLKGLALKYSDVKKVIFAFKEIKKNAHRDGVKAAKQAMRDALGIRDFSPYSGGNA